MPRFRSNPVVKSAGSGILFDACDEREVSAMNQTILALLSALSIYGLTSLALPRGPGDATDDTLDAQTIESAEAAPAATAEDDGSQVS